ncbi:MAG: ATP-binding cassette domain-containing protein [Vibrio sp.]
MSLSLVNIGISKQERSLLQALNLTVEKGEILTLMGPSGCGKSTLLDMIAGHTLSDFSYQGQIFLDQSEIQDLAPHLRSIGILFQDDFLFPHLSVWENIAAALPKKIKGKQRQQTAVDKLRSVELEAIADSMPHQISGGQRARVSLIRMLSANPKAVLLDEPFSKLDPELRINFRQWVFEQLEQANIPTIMVTHDSDDAPENGRLIHWNKLKEITE